MCAFASNIHADMIVCLLMYILNLQSIIYLRLKRVSFINVCVVHVSLLCDELGNWVLMILSPMGSPSVISGISIYL